MDGFALCILIQNLLSSEARKQMIVDDADRLQMGVHDGWSQEFEASFLQVFADFFGKRGFGRKFFDGFKCIDNGFSVNKSPEIGIEGAELLLDLKKELGVVDGGFDL